METKVDPETFDLFRAIGKTGDNYTGIYAGGMEVGKEHVLVTALSTPQGGLCRAPHNPPYAEINVMRSKSRKCA